MSARNWIAVACAEHVGRGRIGGFMQVCHGKAAPLRRLQAGDWVAYYSPTTQLGGKDKLQAFTALGKVKAGVPYPFPMSEDFCPHRRDVDWQKATAAPIRPLLEQLSFSKGQRNWAYALRFGLLEISDQDMQLIAQEMTGVKPS